MISSIQKLKNFGIFKNYNNKATQNFGRYNLIYGWNGTGKSTLSGLFSSLEKRTTNPSFNGSEFTVTTDTGSTVTEKISPQAILTFKFSIRNLYKKI